MMRRQLSGRLAGALVLAAVLAVAGCRGGNRAASVSGHVNYNGKPVTSGTVVFISADGKSSDPGAVQPDGSYTIAHAPTGTVRVFLNNPAPPRTAPPLGQKGAANDPEYQEAAKAAALYVPTPPKYKDPDQSGLTCELKGGSNTYDVVLK